MTAKSGHSYWELERRTRRRQQQGSTFHLLRIARSLLGRPEEPAHDAQEDEVEHEPEVARDPLHLPPLVVLVCHLHTQALTMSTLGATQQGEDASCSEGRGWLQQGGMQVRQLKELAHLIVHLIGDPGHAEPHHDGQRVGEPPACSRGVSGRAELQSQLCRVQSDPASASG